MSSHQDDVQEIVRRQANRVQDSWRKLRVGDSPRDTEQAWPPPWSHAHVRVYEARLRRGVLDLIQRLYQYLWHQNYLYHSLQKHRLQAVHVTRHVAAGPGPRATDATGRADNRYLNFHPKKSDGDRVVDTSVHHGPMGLPSSPAPIQSLGPRNEQVGCSDDQWVTLSPVPSQSGRPHQ